MARPRGTTEVDEALLSRVSALDAASQRWLKTALQAIRLSELPAGEVKPEALSGYLAPPAPRKGRPRRAADLEDVISGKADLRQQLQDYPELAEELEGLAEIVEKLREAGKRRRRRGEQILREEILGEKPPSDEMEEPEEESGDG